MMIWYNTAIDKWRKFVLLLPAGCGVVAADVIGAEPARPGSPVWSLGGRLEIILAARKTKLTFEEVNLRLGI